MIRVAMPPEPAHHDAQVRVPGRAFLTDVPHPSTKQWNRNRYWSLVHDALYDGLGGICSYCATYTPRRRSPGVDHTSIDHFVPKGRVPELAYEWSNFRLSRSKLNTLKGNFEDVIDPYVVVDGWFRLSFSSFKLYPEPSLTQDEKLRIERTIARLELNQDDKLVEQRSRAVYMYADGQLTFAYLQRYYPLIAHEMLAQDFDVHHLPKFKQLLANPRIRNSLGLHA